MKRIKELVISPAPWKKAVDNFGMGENMIWDSGNRRVVYNGIDSCFTRENMEANHNMMVAAPELYETEYDLVNVIERLMNGWAGTCDTPSQDEVVAALDAAKSAIAKAAGDEETK